MFEFDASKQPKKATVNLFIDSYILEELRKEAGEKETSLNSRISLILRKYLEFYKRAEEVDETCIIAKKYFQFLVDYIDEKDNIAELTETFRRWIPAVFNDRNLTLTLDNFIQHVCTGIGLSSRTIDNFTHYIDETGIQCLVFTHGFGMKWSNVLSSAVSIVIKELIGYQTNTTIYRDGFIIKILNGRNQLSRD